MKVLYLSAEVEPFAKVGGLADVAGSLPRELVNQGLVVRVAMPAYHMVLDQWESDIVPLSTGFDVNLNRNKSVPATVYSLEHRATSHWLVDIGTAFSRVTCSEEVYSPQRDDYLAFVQATIAACRQVGWIPDVVHANDWHMAFAPVFVREKTDWCHSACVYSIHNMAYQGQFGRDTLEEAGLPESTFSWDKLESWGGVNFLKSGCAYADHVNTVSPTYAQEIQSEDYGCGLWGLMHHLADEGRLHGILNGIDTESHDPQSDPRISAHFGPASMEGKSECKAALCRELGLEKGRPLLGVVSRLSEQKGFDLILPCVARIIEAGASLVILAIGDPTMAVQFKELAAQNPNRIAFCERYDADLAQRVYAGIDIFLMPSKFEPCGLGQMFALRYGSVPVVRKTGGLADSVFDGVNGFVFDEATPDALWTAIDRALSVHGGPEWTKLVHAGMTADFSWSQSAKKYVELYDQALSGRRILSKQGCTV